MTSPDEPSLHKVKSAPDLDANDRLYKLQYHDSDIFEWDENSSRDYNSVEDDVNALSLSTGQKSSFVGISSVAAAIRALTRVLPTHFNEQKPMNLKSSPSVFETPLADMPLLNFNRIASYRDEQRLIDAYFATIHVFAPIIHEPSFRNKYLTSHDCQDRSWLALLNMVLALGSVASSPGDSDEDCRFYHLAQQCLSLESFGNGRLETLQALVLMGGQYLHFRNRPNTASAIIGACYRIASGLGLHLKLPEDFHGHFNLPEEIKRRNWWTIYVLDTWGSVTLGRPSVAVGAMIDLPSNILDDQRGELSPSEPTIHSPLIHNIHLCKIINRIQDRLLVSSILSHDELQFYDKMLVSWFETLPSFLKSSGASALDLQDARLVLKWRYQNIRFLLHRPLLLDTVIRKTPFFCLSSNEKAIVSRCREIAAESISSIQTEWRPNKICCWNAIWFIFQACLIPLMALAVESTEHTQYRSWCHQVEVAITVCDEMSRFSPVGQRTKIFLQKLYFAVAEDAMQTSMSFGATEAPPSLDTIMGIFAGDWESSNGGFFPQLNPSCISDMDDQFLLAQYQSYS
ncbi:hypothetical protein N7462_007038 [Penicillium macrosclerotiorum]|uniref:uncharacterized protein n=1 Tax=Penicillium macrosclerotiorum TaxID=303699 RepID=UPI00254862E0|nr:uncharacterized protein N7462_007038 [Penicillium macrosclerotiorum]KAJ5678794.1 hypothetical protein N7462_007038 [Penicillium macrosclerotiorum]